MKFEVLQDYVMIEEIKVESKSKIIIAEDVDLKGSHKAKVLEVGPDVVGIKKGDIALIKDYGFDEIELEDKKYLLGKQENIYAIIK